MSIDYTEKKNHSPKSNAPSKQKLEYQTKNITPQCKIVCYQWRFSADEDEKVQLSDSFLSATTRLDVSSQVTQCTFSKTMGRPSGSFSFMLSNSPGIGKGDWKDIIKRGMWCVIYMSTDGSLNIAQEVGAPQDSETNNIRCVGFIDRVAVQSSLDPRGAFDVQYEISGRDFGVVYEDTMIWHNVFLLESNRLRSFASAALNITGAVTVSEALDLMHDLFYFPLKTKARNFIEKKTSGGKSSILDVALQWLMPNELIQDVGWKVKSASFWGALVPVKRFSDTKATLSIANPTDFLTGNAWNALKQISTPELHELYTETTPEGLPQLIFRPIPFATDKSKYPLVGKNIILYKDLKPLVTIPAVDVIDFSVGEDNHNRYNSFLTTIDTTQININDMLNVLAGTGFPKHIPSSIKRYGFRPMHTTVHSLVRTAKRGNGEGDPVLIKEFNHVMEDYWRPAVYSETGTVNLIGNSKIKIGFALEFGENTPYLSGKRYYIEGYVDTFNVNPNGSKTWETAVYLTRGFSILDLEKQGFSDQRKDQFVRQGEFTSSEGA